MRAVSEQVEAAITHPDRVIDAVVGVDWDSDGYGDTRTVHDSFTSTAAIDSWGTADTHQQWRLVGAGGTVAASDWQKPGTGVGTLSVPATSAYRAAWLTDVTLTDVEVVVTASTTITDVTGGEIEPVAALLRVQDDGTYLMARAEVATTEAITLKLIALASGAETELASTVLAGYTHTGQPMRLHAQAIGGRLRAKLIIAGQPPPTTWQVWTLDTPITTAGGIGVRAGLGATNSNTSPVVYSVHDVAAYDLAATPAPSGVDNLSPLVSGWSLDRAVVGDLPDQARLVQGSAAAQATITIDRAPLLQQRGQIGVRAYNTAANGADAAGGDSVALLPAPEAVVKSDLLITALAYGTVSGTAPVYALARDVWASPGDPLPPAGGWTERLDDTTVGGTLLRTQIHTKWAGDVDASYASDPDGVYGWAFGGSGDGTVVWAAAVVSVGPLLAARPGVWRVAAHDQAADASTTDTHTTPTVEVTDPGTILITVFAARTTTAVTWAVDSADTLLQQTRGSHGTVNVALAVAVSAPLSPGRYERTATTSAAVTGATAAIIAVAPVQATDESRHAGWYLSPLNSASAVSNRDSASVRADLAVRILTDSGPQTVPRLTGGLLRGISASGDGRNATLTVLDRREQLRAAVVLPALNGAVHGANATWVITQALLASGFSPSPRPPGLRLASEASEPPAYAADVVFHYSFHGSVMPSFLRRWQLLGGGLPNPPGGNVIQFVGGADSTVAPTFVPGPFALGVSGSFTDDENYLRVVDFAEGDWHELATRGRWTAWIRGDDAGTPSWGAPELVYTDIYTDDYEIYVGVNADRQLGMVIGGDVEDLATGPSLPADGEWHFVGIAWDLEAGRVWWRVDDTDSTTTISTLPSQVATEVGYAASLPIAELMLVEGQLDQPWPNEGFVADAVVDPSSLDLRYYYERQPRESWDLITDIGRAEGAVVHIDEDGVFRYRTRARYRSAQMQTVQLTLTAARNITTIRADHQVDLLANLISHAYTEPYTEWDYTTRLTEPVRLEPAAVNQRITVTPDDPYVDLGPSILPVSTASTTTSYIICNTRPDGSGLAVTANITASYAEVTADGRVVVQVSNGNGIPVYVTELRLFAQVIRTRSVAPAIEGDEVSIARHGQQPLTIAESQWVQTAEQARWVARQVLLDLRNPQPVITNLDVVGDPRLQLLDRVRLIDRDGLGVDGDWWITGIREQYQAGSGYTQRITARRALPVAVWGQFAWGQAIWGSGG